ncbi:alpha/beta hydrolase [Cupriavidus oxalaticus]|uniref:alpha/beta hydrolase n=1 Tax=Cupriavidus oxalaticus TaxID=96344 RepID=UPI0031820709
MRAEVEFRAEDGVTLRGWKYVPDIPPNKPAPAIVMINGFSGVKETLTQYAQAFQAEGFAVLLYDHRNFGASDGQPRLHIEPSRQLADLRCAVTVLRGFPEVDPERIGMWGTSLAGGHAIVTAANDRRIKCVVSQIPFISGHRSAERFYTVHRLTELRQMFDDDRQNRLHGEPSAMLPVVSDSEDFCCLPSPVSKRFVQASIDQAAAWRNEVTIGSLENLFEYEPGALIKFVSPTPLLMIVGARDNVCFPDLAFEAYENALEPKSLYIHRAGHWGTYFPPYLDATAYEACKWFKEHLITRMEK